MGFIVSPVGFLISPVENLLLGLNPEKFENLAFSPVSQAVPTGVLRQGVIDENTLVPLFTHNSFDRCVEFYVHCIVDSVNLCHAAGSFEVISQNSD